jgi:hypothetical protein
MKTRAAKENFNKSNISYGCYTIIRDRTENNRKNNYFAYILVLVLEDSGFISVIGFPYKPLLLVDK